MTTASAHARLRMETVRRWLAEQGWEAHPLALYDDECVEGWSWEHADLSHAHTTEGDWNADPAIPDALMEMALAALMERA